jgi:large subunit ribosomal protein L13
MKTYVPSRKEIERSWWIVDADGMTLGRIASAVAVRLRGKHKPIYTPHLDTGDHVIVVNCEKVALTGTKLRDKMYRRHSGYPGGLTEIPADEMLARWPERVLESAIRGMLPKGPLGRQMFRKLKVYRGSRHPHQAQAPRPLPIPGASRAH